jgi:DNA ligase-1
MNRFAELLDRLGYEPGRNNKLRLLTAYFREVGDPDRGYALAALTGALSFKHAKPGLIRDLIAERTDPVLFGLSYDYVGDLSETVALMWPKGTSSSPHASSAPSPARGGGLGWGLLGWHSSAHSPSDPVGGRRSRARLARPRSRGDGGHDGGGDPGFDRRGGGHARQGQARIAVDCRERQYRAADRVG